MERKMCTRVIRKFRVVFVTLSMPFHACLFLVWSKLFTTPPMFCKGTNEREETIIITSKSTSQLRSFLWGVSLFDRGPPYVFSCRSNRKSYSVLLYKSCRFEMVEESTWIISVDLLNIKALFIRKWQGYPSKACRKKTTSWNPRENCVLGSIEPFVLMSRVACSEVASTA